jgi:isopentenyl phosphate kinase
MTTVVKLGGSVITEKDVPETVDTESLDRAADALADREDLVVVHGGGSFGHHHADRHGITTTAGSRDPDAIREIHRAMTRLNAAVVEALDDAGVPAIPITPLSTAYRDEDASLTVPVGQLTATLGEGFIPVLHGDVVIHEGHGATVLSGDELLVHLAEALDADRVGVCSAVPGVYDDKGTVIDAISSIDEVGGVLGESEATDVSGGMAGKVRELLALNADAFVFDLEGLRAFLEGDRPGTRIG